MSGAGQFYGFLFWMITCPIAFGEHFDYLQNADLFKYLEIEHAGLSLFPMSNGGETSKLADNERKNIRSGYRDGTFTNNELKDLARALLASDNHLGFLHLSAAIARTGKEEDAMRIYEDMLGKDSKKNFCVLYGAYIIQDFSGAANRLKPALRRIIGRIRREKLPILKTNRYPNLVETVAGN